MQACGVANFRKLLVWQKAHVLALLVDRLAGGIRGARYSTLRSQLTRAAMSIAANIVEGKGQESTKDFIRFLRYSVNSSNELEYHLLVARDIGAISDADFEPLEKRSTEVRKMLHGLINRLRDR